MFLSSFSSTETFTSFISTSDCFHGKTFRQQDFNLCIESLYNYSSCIHGFCWRLTSCRNFVILDWKRALKVQKFKSFWLKKLSMGGKFHDDTQKLPLSVQSFAAKVSSLRPNLINRSQKRKFKFVFSLSHSLRLIANKFSRNSLNKSQWIFRLQQWNSRFSVCAWF